MFRRLIDCNLVKIVLFEEFVVTKSVSDQHLGESLNWVFNEKIQGESS